MFIYWNSSVIKSSPFLPIYLFNYVSMNSGLLTLFLALKSSAMTHFVAQIVPTLAIRKELLQIGPWVLSTKPPTFFEHFLISSTTKVFQADVYFPCLSPGINYIPPKSSWFENQELPGCSLLLEFHCQANNLDKPAPMFASFLNSLAGNHEHHLGVC